MIKNSEFQLIHSYLTVSQLPEDVLLEVKDHFRSQILAHMESEGLSFLKAFERTKLEWKPEFRMVKKSFFSFSKAPKIVKEIQGKACIHMVRKSLLCAIGFLFLNILLSRILNMNYFIVTQIGVSVVAFSFFMALLLWYFSIGIKKRRTRSELYFYTNLLNLFLVYILFQFLTGWVKLPTNDFKIFYEFVNYGSSAFEIGYFLVVVADMLFKITAIGYIYFMMKDREKSVRKLKIRTC